MNGLAVRLLAGAATEARAAAAPALRRAAALALALLIGLAGAGLLVSAAVRGLAIFVGPAPAAALIGAALILVAALLVWRAGRRATVAAPPPTGLVGLGLVAVFLAAFRAGRLAAQRPETPHARD